MEPSTGVLMAVSVAVVAGLLGYGLADAWRYTFRGPGPLPLYSLMRRTGITLGEARESVGPLAVDVAAWRCVRCESGGGCGARVAAGMPALEGCPNAPLLETLGRPRVPPNG